MSSQVTSDVRFSIVPEWLLDADITDRAVRVYAILARYADNETMQAFPSRETLAKRANCHWRSIDRAIDELVELGAITKHHRKLGETYQSNVYTLRRVLTAQSGGTDTRVRGVLTAVSGGTDTGGNLTRTTELELNNYIDTTFNEFWSVYPKKADKRAALKAFKSALKRASLEVIISGARKYAADPNREDRFTKNPATWLNADAWENESLPSKITNLKPPAEGPGRGDWIKQLHDIGEHFACNHD